MKTKITKKKKRKAPEKACPQCDTANHARSSNCKSCDYTFYVRKKVREVELAKNWRELVRGDIIKVTTGSGPYWISKDKGGDKIYMGQKGKFEVIEIYDQGPRCCGIYGRPVSSRGRLSHYQEFIYMGDPCYDDDMNLHREPHKIKVIKKQG